MQKQGTYRGARIVWALLAVLCLLPGGAFAEGSQAQAVRLEDDYYDAINGEWLAAAVIPDGQLGTGTMFDRQAQVEEQLMADFAAMAPETAAQFECLPDFLEFYAMVSDYEARNTQGAQPLAPYLEEIRALGSLADLQAALPGLIVRGIQAPVDCTVEIDFDNGQRYALAFRDPTLFLPDKAYYGTPEGDALLGAFGQMINILLQQCGYGEEEAAQITRQALAFDALIAPHTRPAEEMYAFDKMNNPMTIEEVAAYGTGLNLEGLTEALVPALPEKVFVYNPAYYAALNRLVIQDNFSMIRDWMTVKLAYQYANMLSKDIMGTVFSYESMLYGLQEAEDAQKLAYRVAYEQFDEPVGIYYGKTYFSHKARQDVAAMAEQLKDAFKKRIPTYDWLAPQTVEAAQRKLDNLTFLVGYPDEEKPAYKRLKVTAAQEGGTVISNIMEFKQLKAQEMFAMCGGPVDHTQWWGMNGTTTGAGLNPQANTIMIPAGLMHPQIYSPEHSASRNLGSLGAIIGHEITHAFDNSGAMFDENGSMVNWWTEADLAAFEQRTEAMVALFDGLPYGGLQINGRMTVGENTADAGGLSVAWELCRALPAEEHHEFFEGWAQVWRMIYLPEVEALVVATDPHPPAKLHVNVQLSNMDAFYGAYDIQEGDGMYIAPEKRVKVW